MGLKNAFKVIHESEDKTYRIIEIEDHFFNFEDLKGDCFNPKVNTDIDSKKLAKEEREFEDLVNREGVFGYALERWNPSIGIGWEHVDSCYGFVGQYNENQERFKHYIVDELKGIIKAKTGSKQ